MQTLTMNKLFRNLRAGQTIYFVIALGNQSYMSSHVVTSRPYLKSDLGHFFDTQDSQYSVSDRNGYTTPNGYNKHKAFSSKRKAMKYLNDCKTFGFDLDYYDDCGDDYNDYDGDW